MLLLKYLFDNIRVFLRQDITCIPNVINKYVTKHYNNALSNSAFWLITLWLLFHWIFNSFLNALLKRMKIRLYNRQRIINSLWYSGFYAGCLFYTGATLFQNDTDPFDNFRIYALLRQPQSTKGHYMFGYMVLLSFFIQGVIWELWNNGFHVQVVDFALLSTFLIIAWLLSVTEFALAFLLTISICRLSVELSRICSTITKLVTLLKWGQFGLSIIITLGMHMMILPNNFVCPVINVSMYIDNKPLAVLMNICLIIWYIIEFLTSPIFRTMRHYLTHSAMDIKINKCCGNFLECVLFAPRNDLAFHLQRAYSDLQRREEQRLNSVNFKKRQSQLTLMQTIKCMVAIQRKVKKQRERKQKEDNTTDNVNDG